MKVELARVGSVSLWAKTEWPDGVLALNLWMESTLAGQPRQIGMLLQFEGVTDFVRNVKDLLKHIAKGKP